MRVGKKFGDKIARPQDIGLNDIFVRFFLMSCPKISNDVSKIFYCFVQLFLISWTKLSGWDQLIDLTEFLCYYENSKERSFFMVKTIDTR